MHIYLLLYTNNKHNDSLHSQSNAKQTRISDGRRRRKRSHSANINLGGLSLTPTDNKQTRQVAAQQGGLTYTGGGQVEAGGSRWKQVGSLNSRLWNKLPGSRLQWLNCNGSARLICNGSTAMARLQWLDSTAKGMAQLNCQRNGSAQLPKEWLN